MSILNTYSCNILDVVSNITVLRKYLEYLNKIIKNKSLREILQCARSICIKNDI